MERHLKRMVDSGESLYTPQELFCSLTARSQEEFDDVMLNAMIRITEEKLKVDKGQQGFLDILKEVKANTSK